MTLQKKRILFLLVIVFGYIIFVGGCRHPGMDAVADVRILVVHSYNLDYPWTRAEDDGIMYVLGDKGFTLKKFFMDTQRYPGEEYRVNIGQKALALVSEFKPQIVIATDDNAQEYFGRHLVNRKHISLIFCGVNAEASQYNYPGNNVTGIYERVFIRDSLYLLKKAVPSIKTFSILSDTSSTSSSIAQYLKKLNLNIQMEDIILTNDFDRWKHAVKSIQSDALILYVYHTVMKDKEYIEPKEVIRWTLDNWNKPTLGLSDFAVEDGVLLGRVESGFEHGEMAAKQALEIIKGKKTSEIPITTAHKGLVLINERTARRLEIDISIIKNIADKVFH